MIKKFHIIQLLAFVIAQVSITGFTNFGPILFICFYPLFILTYTPNNNSVSRIVIAFLLGISIDLFSNGILGINAASATLLAFIAPTLRNAVCGRTEYDTSKRLGINELGVKEFSIYTILAMTIFQTYYFFLESFDIILSIDDILRFIISLTLNSALIVLIEYSFFSKRN